MRRILVVPALAMFTVGCAATSDSNDGKFDQAWSKSYGSTTCDDWNDSMSEDEKFVAAADMLTGARNMGDGGSGLPDDSLARQFQGGMDVACVIPTESITGISAALYLAERATFRP